MAKKICILAITALLAIPLFAQKTLQLEECRQMALAHNKSIQIAQENVKAARQLKQAAFAQFLPNFSANAVYTWNQKNISLLAEDAYLPTYAYNANGSVNYANSWNNSWAMVNNTPVPLDANGKPFNPSTNPEKIEWKNKALLPRDAMEYDVKNVFVGTIGVTQPIFMGGKIKALYDIAKYGEHLANAQQENKETELLQEVDEDYWRVVSLESKVALAREYKSLIVKMDSDIRIMGSSIDLIGLIIPFLLASVFFAMTISVFLPNRETGMLVFGIFSLILLFLGGISWPFSNMPGFWRAFGWIFPSTHVTPSGVAIARGLNKTDKQAYLIKNELSPLASAYARARGTDRLASFGDFIALSHPVDKATALLIKSEVCDGIVAPGYDQEALEMLAAKKKGGFVVFQIDAAYEPAEIESREVFGITVKQKRNNLHVAPPRNAGTYGRI